MTTQPKGHGFVYEEPVAEDFVFGAERSLSAKFRGEILQPDGQWSAYLPEVEHQAPAFESNCCVSFGTNNVAEILKKRLFIEEINLSDRMVCKESGTNPNAGNSPKPVAEYLRKKWSVFEPEWPMRGVATVEEYYKEIPNNLKTLAIARGAEYDFGYELISTSNVPLALTYSPLGMSVPAWAFDDTTQTYYRPQGWGDNHWVTCYGLTPEGHYKILDSYPPYLKVVNKNIEPRIIFGYYLRRKIVSESWFKTFLDWISKVIEEVLSKKTYDDPTVPADVTPTPTVTPPNEVPISKLELWAESIKIFEDYVPPGGTFRDGTPAPTGSLSWKNKNPGNIRNLNGTFIIFDTYQDGYNYLCEYLIRAATGKHRAYPRGGETTLNEFCHIYSGDGEPAQTNYALFIAKNCGVKPETRIKDLL